MKQILNSLDQTARLLGVFAVLLFFGVRSAVVNLYCWDEWKRREIRHRLTSISSKIILGILRVQTEVKGYRDFRKSNFLMVSNHLSYLDVLVISSQVPTGFVTSMEIKRTPFLGQLTDLGGCLYVERRNKRNLLNEVEQLSEGLRRGMNIAVFPEATSTNGDSVLRFRRPLYNAAINAQRATLPICLNYKQVNGQSLSVRNRDLIYWYGEMGFLPHLWALAGAKGVLVEMNVLEPLLATPEVEDHYLAETSHQRVTELFVPCPTV